MRRKILAIVGIMLAAMLVALFAAARLILLRSFAALEQRAAAAHMARVESAVEAELLQLGTVAADYAGWDESYRFVRNHDRRFIEENLAPAIYPKLRLSALVFLDAAGRIVYQQGYDLSAKKPDPMPEGLAAHLLPRSPLLRPTAAGSGASGLLRLPGGPLLAVSRPVLTSDYRGPSRGTVVFARFLDAAEVKRLGATVHLPVEVLAPEQTDSRDDLSGAPRVRVGPDGRLEVTELLRDLYGRPGALLRLRLPREIYHQGRQTILYFVGWSLVLSLSVFLVAGRFLDKLFESRRSYEEALERYRAVVETASEGIALAAPSGWRFLEANRAAAELLGYPMEELLRMGLADVLADGLPGFELHVVPSLREGISRRLEARLVTGGGALIETELSASPILREGSAAVSLVIRDVTERKRFEAELMHQATHDALTGLPNRSTLEDRLNQAVAFSGRMGRLAAVMLLDLDRFKNVNDTLGHSVGDRLLRLVAERLRETTRRYNTVARLGGDEFVLILSSVPDTQHVIAFAEKVMESFGVPFELDAREFFVTASMGISLYPNDGSDVDTLLRSADTAMYQVKEHGRNAFQFFAADMNLKVQERLRLESGLRRAIERGEFLLHYQPKVKASTGEVAGVEALLRWQPPGEEMIVPDRIIPVLEETGLIVPVGDWVLRTACRQCRAWLDAGVGPLHVAVNISARQFHLPDLPDRIGAILQETGLAAGHLAIEVTESTMMANVADSARQLGELKSRGVRIAIDDFGTGYSSLAYLKRFPIDDLKIDRSFVMGMPDEADNEVLVRTIIDLAHNLRMEVVAEGVETEEQLRFLSKEGCEEVQGFLLGRPLPAAELESFLRGALTPGSRPPRRAPFS